MTLCERARICRYCALITFNLWWKRVLNVAILSAGFLCRGPLYLSVLVRQRCVCFTCCEALILIAQPSSHPDHRLSGMQLVRRLGPPWRWSSWIFEPRPLVVPYRGISSSSSSSSFSTSLTPTFRRRLLLFQVCKFIQLQHVLFKCVNNLRKWILQPFYFIHVRL